MRRAALALAILISGFSAASAGPASDAVRRFYQPEVGFEPDLAIRDRFVDPAKSVFERNDKLSKDGDQLGCIDFVLAIDAQDFSQNTLDDTLKLAEKLSGDTAEVTATFELFTDQENVEREIVWSLRKVGGEWKVADIASLTGEWRLSEFDCE